MERGLKIAIAAVVMIDVILLGVFALNQFSGNYKARQRRDALAKWIGDAPELTEEQRTELYNQAAGRALSYVTINSEATARDGRINLEISNRRENECAVGIEIVHLDTGEIIAETDLLDPGYCLKSVALRRELPKGRAECLVRMKFYWMNNDAYVGSGARQLLLNVE